MSDLSKRVVRKVGSTLARLITPVVSDPSLERLGSLHGGWWVPMARLGTESVCYSAGVGEDTTFDEALISAVGCDVWGLDPTPRAVAHARTIQDPRFHLETVGVFGEDRTMRFYAPRDPHHVSHSVTNAQSTETYFEAECQTVRTIMRRLGHDEVDLLKLDIEGAEASVLDDLLSEGPHPRVLCVELDQPEMPWLTLARLKRLRRTGYECLRVEGRNFTFALSA